VICCAPERAAFDKKPDRSGEAAPAAGSLFGSASCRRIDFYDGSEAILELPSVEAMTLN